MIFFLHDIKLGWKLWYRRWRNSVLRFGGWITFKNWTSDFKRNVFSDKINYARASLCSRGNLQSREADVFYDRFCQMILFAGIS